MVGLALASRVALAASAPVVDSFTSGQASVAPGETVTLTLQAHDPDCTAPPCTDCGTYVREDLTGFTATGGTLGIPNVGAPGSPYQASVSWTAPAAEGTYTVTATISDSGGMMCGGRMTTTARVSVGVSATPLPVVESFTASPTRVVPGGSSFLGVTAHDPLGRPVSVSFSAAGGSVQPTSPGATTALFTAPASPGPVAVTVTVTPDGGSPASATLSVLVEAGLYAGLLPTGGRGVTRVTSLSDGRVATVDAAAGGACAFDPASGAVSWCASGLASPVAIARSGAEYFVLERGTGTISVLDDSGSRTRSIPSPAAFGTDLVAGPGAGELSVSETEANRVWVVSAASGTVLGSLGDGALSQPTGLASFDGKLAVADTGNARVIVFDASGTATTTITDAVGLVRPQGLAWDATRGLLAVADVFTGQVFLVGLDGTVAGSFGGFGPDAGQLTNPSDLDVLASGLVAVSSAEGGQVTLFRIAPAPPASLRVVSTSGVCAGGSASASVTGASPSASYEWFLTGGIVLTGQNTASITFAAAGTDTGSVTLQALVLDGGASSTVTSTVPLAVPPATPVATASGPVCSGGSVQLAAVSSPGAVYLWTGPNGFASTDPNPLLARAGTDASGVYTVVASNGGCPSPAVQVVVEVLPAPSTPRIALSAWTASPNERSLTASVAPDPDTTYEWTVLNGTLLSGQGSPSIVFDAGARDEVTLLVSARNASGCTSEVARAVLPIGRDDRRWVVPGMAYSPGANGTLWVSELNVHNPDPARPLEVSFSFLDGRPGAAGAPEWKSVPVAPGQLLRFPNVLSSLFGLPPGSFGALVARVAGGSPLPIVSGRNYNDQAERGTFGQGFSAVAVETGLLSPNAAVGTNVLAGLKENAEGRTNLMLVNAGDLAARVSVRLLDASGQPLGEAVEVSVERYRMVQLSRVLSAPAPGGAGVDGPVDSFRAVVTVLEGTGVYSYATVVDNASGDPVLVTPAERPAAALRLAALVRAGGVNGTVWRSDLVLANPGSGLRRLRLSYAYTSSEDGHAARRVHEDVATLNPGETIEARDFAAVWLGLSPGSTTSVLDPLLDISPAADDPSPGEPVLAFARVYNDQPSGRVGLQVTPVTPADGIDSPASASGTRLVLSGLESDAAYRTNVVLYLASADPSAFASGTLRVLDGEGRTLGSIPFSLDQAGRPTLQLNNAELFAGAAADTSRVTLSVEGIAGTAPVAAYATVVDQLSGDATCQAGQPAGDGR